MPDLEAFQSWSVYKLPGGLPVRRVENICMNSRMPMVIESEVMPEGAGQWIAEEEMRNIFLLVATLVTV